MTLKEIADRAYFKKYGITRVDGDARIAAQGNKCAICGNSPKTQRLNTDHDHKFRWMKVQMFGMSPRVWSACITFSNREVFFHGTTRSETLKKARFFLRTESVRGFLCPRCNQGLQMFRDSPIFLRKAADYLEAFSEKVGAIYL